VALAIKAISDADANTAQQQFDKYKLQLDTLSQQLEEWKARTEASLAKQEPEGGDNNAGGDTGSNDSGGVSGMEGQPDNGQGAAAPDQMAGQLPGGVPAGGDIDAQLSGANSNSDLRAVGQSLRNKFNAGDTGGIEGRAGGGDVNAGQPYVVGEEGPEVIVPQGDATVIPNTQYTRADKVVQDAEYVRAYDGAKYYKDAKALQTYNALKDIIDSRPNGTNTRMKLEAEVDKKYKK
jgi:hypothetical protein